MYIVTNTTIFLIVFIIVLAFSIPLCSNYSIFIKYNKDTYIVVFDGFINILIVFTITKVQLHVSAINIGHLQVVHEALNDKLYLHVCNM